MEQLLSAYNKLDIVRQDNQLLIDEIANLEIQKTTIDLKLSESNSKIDSLTNQLNDQTGLNKDLKSKLKDNTIAVDTLIQERNIMSDMLDIEEKKYAVLKLWRNIILILLSLVLFVLYIKF